MNVIEDVQRQLNSTTVTSAGPPTEEIIRYFGECWVRKDQIYLLLAVAEAAIAYLAAESAMFPAVNDIGSEERWEPVKQATQAKGALRDAIAPLLEEVMLDAALGKREKGK